MAISLSSAVVRGAGQTHAELNNDVVMMNLESGDYYGLSGIAARIWNIIIEPCSVNEICQIITSEYEVDRSVCEADVLRFLAEMSEKSLIEILQD